MSRKHKKRSKQYTGTDSIESKPVVHHYKAVVRSPLGEWWHENYKRIRIISLIVGGVVVVVWLLFELLNVIF